MNKPKTITPEGIHKEIRNVGTLIVVQFAGVSDLQNRDKSFQWSFANQTHQLNTYSMIKPARLPNMYTIHAMWATFSSRLRGILLWIFL